MKIAFYSAAALSLGLALAGCGGGNGGIVTPTPLPTTSSTLYSLPTKLPAVGQIYGLNNRNQIVATNSSATQSVILNGPTATPEALKFYNGSYIVATGINSTGTLIGASFVNPLPSAPNVILPPLYWANASATPQPLKGVTGVGIANDINDSGAIVGYGPRNAKAVALYWSSPSAEPTALTLPAGEDIGSALGINSQGNIAGTVGAGTIPVYWSSSTATAQKLTRLSEQTARLAYMGINANGNVFLTDNNSVSVFYSSPSATPTPLPFLPNASINWGGSIIGAYAMNASGVVVGSSPDSSGNLRAVRWVNGTVQDLNSLIPTNSGWVLRRAWQINDSGVIVGTGTYNGADASFYMALQ